MKAEWLEVWRVEYVSKHGDQWGEPRVDHVLTSGRDGMAAVTALRDSLLAPGKGSASDFRLISVNYVARAALFPGTSKGE